MDSQESEGLIRRYSPMVITRIAPRPFIAVAAVTLIFASAPLGQTPKRRFTVTDGIEMTTVVDPDNTDEPVRPVEGSPAKRSPDGRRFALITMRGDAATNMITYSLVVYDADTLFTRPAPREVLKMTSSSSRAGISSIRWLADARRIAFLGERPHETPQLFVVDTSTGEVTQLTDQGPPIKSYDITPDGSAWVYSARPPDRVVPDESKARGYAITSTDLSLVLHGLASPPVGAARDIYYGRKEWGRKSRKIQSAEEVWFFTISPNGRYVVESLPAKILPGEWDQYQSDWLRRALISQRQGGDLPSYVHQLHLVDLRTSSVKPLLNAPGGWSPQPIFWDKDETEAVVYDSYLPPAQAAEHRCWSRDNLFSVSVSGRVTPIKACPDNREQVEPAGWDPHTGVLLLRSKRNPESGYLKYARRSGKWVYEGEQNSSTAGIEIEIKIVQGLNQPPQLQAVDITNNRSIIISDLNPQLSRLTLAAVKTFEWSDKNGSAWRGGLYYPPAFKLGVRYPLVIQTHGFPEGRFEVSGSFPTAMAAQPLASRDILVLQLGDPTGERKSGVFEPMSFVAGVEGAIDKLSEMELIDRNRVGLIGFSRTGWYVEYFLTHSDYPIGAATAADNVDQGYLQYLFNMSSVGKAETEKLYSGTLWDNPGPWLREAPGFNLNKIKAPLRLEVESDGIIYPLPQWEMFSGLTRLKKPVDLIYIPDSPHLLVKPWHRLTSQEGNVDWFCFWLKSEEDPAPTKSEQYVRWRKLRDLGPSRPMQK
jgi:dipeptidyl aminopeptidase/acylaminoacyl peptidase